MDQCDERGSQCSLLRIQIGAERQNRASEKDN